MHLKKIFSFIYLVQKRSNSGHKFSSFRASNMRTSVNMIDFVPKTSVQLKDFSMELSSYLFLIIMWPGSKINKIGSVLPLASIYPT